MSSSPLNVDEDSSMVIEKKGIVTILGSDLQLNKAARSLRRTLSADMSSKIWLAQNGISPMKRIASSDELANNLPAFTNSSSSSSSDDEDELDQKPTNVNVSWSSILLSGKTNDDSNINGPPPPPYIHPLAKKSATLNEKSLEICTESLGSETGSDGYSSYTPSETSDVEEADKEEDVKQIQHHENESIEEFPIAKYNYNPGKKLLPRAFPPPLPSIAGRDGPSVQMQSHRENGRLVLEAVSVPQRNYFHAERQEGRLLLRLVENLTSQETCQEEETEEDEVEEFEEVFDNFELVENNNTNIDAEEDEEEEEEIAFLVEQSSSLPSNVINMHKSGPMMKRLRRLENNNPTWSNKLNKPVNFIEVNEMAEEDHLSPFPQSLPPASTVARLQIPSLRRSPTTATAAAASFNAYEYFWRKQPTEACKIDPITQQCTPLTHNKTFRATETNLKAYEHQDLVVMRGNKAGDHLVPLINRCKESRRSLLIWEPHCIATS